MRRVLASSIAAALGLGLACVPSDDDEGTDPFDRLSAYGFFEGDMADLELADGVVPYDPVSPLFSDFALKDRFIALPEGERAVFGADETWDFPEGTIIGKTFSFSDDLREPDVNRRIIETRLLVREDGDWTPHIYLWNDAQTEAERIIVGERVDVEYVDYEGEAHDEEYIVPTVEQCQSCHERDDANRMLGLVTPQLNFELERDGEMVNQLEWLEGHGLFEEAVPDPASLPALVDPMGDDDLDARARAYLHANCSHCHREGGGAGVSGLRFTYWEQDPIHFGICKPPAAAGNGSGGRDYGIVPGAPDESVVVYRMESLDPEEKMPELPSLVLNQRGIDVVRDWVAAMEPAGCDQP